MTLRCVVFVLLHAAMAAAQPAAMSLKATERPAQPPWTWNIEDRLRVRLDPGDMRARAQAHRRSVAVDSKVDTAQPNTADNLVFVIQGQRDPALFLPHELVAVLLRAVDTDADQSSREHLRETFREDIREFGWNPDEFWVTFEKLVAFANASAETQARTTVMSSNAAVRRCRQEHSALQRARAQFGSTEFDRFLYVVIAPSLNLTMPTVTATEATRLRSLEEGCR